MRSKFFVVLLTILAVGILIVLSYRENGIKTYPSYKTSSMRGLHLTHKDGNKIKDKNLIINRPIKIDIDGNKLTTDSLMWNGDKELISTKDAIRFEGKNFIIEGIGLIAKTENQQIKILENVK